MSQSHQGGRHLPPPGSLPGEECRLPGYRDRDQAQWGKGGGELCWLLQHNVEGEKEKPRQILQTLEIQGRDHLEHSHLGDQGQGLHLHHLLEDPRQGHPLHPCDQGVHAVHQGEVLHHQKAGACIFELSSGSCKPLPSHFHVFALQSRESESLVWTS